MPRSFSHASPETNWGRVDHRHRFHRFGGWRNLTCHSRVRFISPPGSDHSHRPYYADPATDFPHIHVSFHLNTTGHFHRNFHRDADDDGNIYATDHLHAAQRMVSDRRCNKRHHLHPRSTIQNQRRRVEERKLPALLRTSDRHVAVRSACRRDGSAHRVWTSSNMGQSLRCPTGR